MAGTGNKKMDIRIQKLQNERGADDSATIYVGSGKELCQSGGMTEKTVKTAEMLISVLPDEDGIAKSNIDIATSTSNPTDPCICLIFWCNNEIEPCNMDIAAEFYDGMLCHYVLYAILHLIYLYSLGLSCIRIKICRIYTVGFQHFNRIDNRNRNDDSSWILWLFQVNVL